MFNFSFIWLFPGEQHTLKSYHSLSTLAPVTVSHFTVEEIEAYQVKFEAYFGNIVVSFPDHLNEANITIKQITQLFWFPSAFKSYVYTIMWSIHHV